MSESVEALSYVCGGQQRVSDALELKLQVLLSFMMWVLETEGRSLELTAGLLEEQEIFVIVERSLQPQQRTLLKRATEPCVFSSSFLPFYFPAVREVVLLC